MSKTKFALDQLQEMLRLKEEELDMHQAGLDSHKAAMTVKQNDIAKCRRELKSLNAAIAGLGSVDRKGEAKK